MNTTPLIERAKATASEIEWAHVRVTRAYINGIAALLREMAERLAQLEAENLEQARMLGISGEKEARHLARVKALEGEVERLRGALDQIFRPIVYMQRKAEAEGGLLDGGMAHYLANDVNYLRGIARAALQETPDEG